jgi:hypothetical protein
MLICFKQLKKPEVRYRFQVPKSYWTLPQALCKVFSTGSVKIRNADVHSTSSLPLLSQLMSGFWRIPCDFLSCNICNKSCQPAFCDWLHAAHPYHILQRLGTSFDRVHFADICFMLSPSELL